MEAGKANRDSFMNLEPWVIQAPERSAAIEWLVTNGLGDFGCGTVAGPNTRRHHGLFTAGSHGDPPGMLLLAALDVTLERGDERYELSCHQYVGIRHPEGFRHCAGFRCESFPEWRYEVSGATLVHRVFMPRGKRCVVCTWSLNETSNGEPWRLRVRPLFAYREADALTMANDAVNMSLQLEKGKFSISPYPECPEMFLQYSRAEVRVAPRWYYHFQHPWDIGLGRDAEEDFFSPCEIGFEIGSGEGAWLVAGLEREVEDADLLDRKEQARRTEVALPGVDGDPISRALARASEAFVIQDAGSQVRIVCKYPVPIENARSTFIALPGLLLCTRRLAEARSLLEDALHRLQDAKAPDALSDVPLWLIRAGEQYAGHSRDWDFLRERLAPACEAFLRRYIDNKSGVGFHLASDGLLMSEKHSPSLTWMDAHLDGWPVTPRTGKPVEVNALWHHALVLANRWARRRGRGDAAARFDRFRELCARSFRQRFWNAAEGCLYDVVDSYDAGGAAHDDSSIRPNQLFAISLSSDLLDRSQAVAVLSFVEKRLITHRGLRTLSLEDPAFRPHYRGTAIERAAARHQGSVFPWLIGAYIDAIFRVHGHTPRACARAEACLAPLLREHLREACFGQCSELFNSVSPHAPQAAFAHAPAVGELIRAYVEIKGRIW